MWAWQGVPNDLSVDRSGEEALCGVPEAADVRGGLFDHMSDLYWHFAENAPRGIAFAKIHKVLHVKYPAVFPLLDSRLWKSYKMAARLLAEEHPDLRQSQLRWIAVRGDLLAARSSGAIEELREAMARYENHDSAVQKHVRDNDPAD